MKYASFMVVYLWSAGAAAAQAPSLPPPVRIDSAVSGHIHPALCMTKKGTLVAVYCKSEYRPYLITRSTDRGKTWAKPVAFPHTVNTQVYPGSLTTLADGRLVHAWNVWFARDDKTQSRYVAYSISSDDGQTWSEPKSLAKAKDPKGESVIRHPIVELSPTAWLLPLMDRTVVYDPTTGQESPLGDGRGHGLVPIVRTAKGTLVSGKGLRSTDNGKSWQEIKPFPDVSSQGWRHEMIAMPTGELLASQIVGPGVGGERVLFVVSHDDGRSWDLDHPIEFYNPGRPIGGRACPRTVAIDDRTLGTIFYDTDARQPGGSGVFLGTTPHPQASTQVRVLIKTDKGDIEVLLDAARAPATVANFLRYVDEHHYDGGRFHRTVTPGNQPDNEVKIEVVQAGANPSRDKEAFAPIKLERTRDTGLKHRDGTISMARDGPDTATSDFFICIGDQPELDFGGKRNPDGQGFAAFGTVVKGMDVVRKIQAAPAAGQMLTPPVKIARIVRLP